MSVFLVLEESRGKISHPSWEALAAAHRLAPAREIVAVVIGADTEALAAEAATKSVGKVVRGSIRCWRRTPPMVFPPLCINFSKAKAPRSG